MTYDMTYDMTHTMKRHTDKHANMRGMGGVKTVLYGLDHVQQVCKQINELRE